MSIGYFKNPVTDTAEDPTIKAGNIDALYNLVNILSQFKVVSRPEDYIFKHDTVYPIPSTNSEVVLRVTGQIHWVKRLYPIPDDPDVEIEVSPFSLGIDLLCFIDGVYKTRFDWQLMPAITYGILITGWFDFIKDLLSAAGCKDFKLFRRNYLHESMPYFLVKHDVLGSFTIKPEISVVPMDNQNEERS